MENLWPKDIFKVKESSPILLIKEQASIIGQKTGNRLVGQVYLGIDPKVIGGFYYYFDLLMPALNNYRYNLFQFRLNIDNSIDLIYYKKTGFKEERYHTLEELKKGLHFFFESDYCKNVISTLLSQVES